MKVLQVVAACAHESSGVSYTMRRICGSLVQNGAEVELHSLDKKPLTDIPYRMVVYPKSSFPSRRLGRSPAMLVGLKDACKTADIIHTNGLWMYPNAYPEWARRGTKCKFVLQPHGTLSEWALSNSKMKKRVFGWLCQNTALRHADMFVATAENEYEDIRRAGYRQPVCVLPNGVDIPQDAELTSYKNGRNGSRHRMFFLSRIHPKKNVDLLLRVWSRLEDKFPEWDLSIVGPDRNNSYADEMKQLSERLRCKRVKFEGEINGESKLEFVAQSDCIVLPTYSENFGMVIAEALACEVPAICSHGAPWEGLGREQCGWWVPTTDEDFEKAMKEVMSMPKDELVRMGARGRTWMQRDFSWEHIGRKMLMSYEWLINGGQCPNFVRRD